jgi:hypothetical protein
MGKTKVLKTIAHIVRDGKQHWIVKLDYSSCRVVQTQATFCPVPVLVRSSGRSPDNRRIDEWSR